MEPPLPFDHPEVQRRLLQEQREEHLGMQRKLAVAAAAVLRGVRWGPLIPFSKSRLGKVTTSPVFAVVSISLR